MRALLRIGLLGGAVALAALLATAGPARAGMSSSLPTGAVLTGTRTVSFSSGLNNAYISVVRLDGRTLAYGPTGAIACRINSSALSEGLHGLIYTARTPSGSFVLRRAFYVSNRGPKLTSISLPQPYGSGRLTLSFDAKDASGLRYLEMRIDGRLLRRAPVSRLVVPLNSRLLLNGRHKLTFRAVDRGNRATVMNVPLDVYNIIVQRIGTSSRGRAIWAYHLGVTRSANLTLFVGGTHGNEGRTRRFLNAFMLKLRASRQALSFGHTVIVPGINPDELAAGTRWNGRRVDLNRNMSAGWGGIGVTRYGGAHYPGRYPFSEPETRALRRIILGWKPRKVLAYHSDLRIIFGNDSLSTRMSGITGYDHRDVGYPTPGSLGLWMKRYLPATTYVLIEMPGGSLTGSVIDSNARAAFTAVRYGRGG